MNVTPTLKRSQTTEEYFTHSAAPPPSLLLPCEPLCCHGPLWAQGSGWIGNTAGSHVNPLSRCCVLMAYSVFALTYSSSSKPDASSIQAKWSEPVHLIFPACAPSFASKQLCLLPFMSFRTCRYDQRAPGVLSLRRYVSAPGSPFLEASFIRRIFLL